MDWESRLLKASISSPSGVVIDFDYEDVSKTISKKTTAFEFPDFNGTFIQDLGHTGRRYPLRLIFSGDDHDIQAEVLESILLEIGVSILTHPVWGSVDVVPFGDIKFRNDLKTASNQTIVDVTFWESIRSLYPINQTDPASAVLLSVDTHTEVASTAFEDTLSIDSEVEKVTIRNEFEILLDNVSNGLESIAATVDNVQNEFDIINRSINNSIDILIGQPLTLAFQTSLLIQAPARASALITDRLQAYKNLADSIFGSGNQPTSENAFRINDLHASGSITGSIISVINTQFDTKRQALEAAENIILQMDNLNTWRDDLIANLTIVDTGEAYQQLQSAVAITVGFLVEISFSLKQERRLTLSYNRTMIDLISELHPDDIIIDDELDFFIQSNNLVGNEILELEAGREIVYYV